MFCPLKSQYQALNDTDDVDGSDDDDDDGVGDRDHNEAYSVGINGVGISGMKSELVSDGRFIVILNQSNDVTLVNDDI